MKPLHTAIITPGTTATFAATEQQTPIRLDTFITQQFAGYSRSYFSQLITNGCVQVGNKVVHKSGTTLKAGDSVSITFPPERTIEPSKLDSVNSNIAIAYQHEHFLVINKPAGLLVHSPHERHTEVTLVDWLLQTRPGIAAVGTPNRPGIIHRLDRDTSGLMIIPLTPYAHAQFAKVFQDRTIQKTYVALVHGHPPAEGTMSENIARDPFVKTKMTCNSGFVLGTSRTAQTNYRVLQYFKEYSLVQAKPVTGRTHQIRVHFAHHGYPILGDPVYGTPSALITRHALHAQALTFTFDTEQHIIQIALPDDMQRVIEKLI